jgi:MSHA biogenesis protein MshL
VNNALLPPLEVGMPALDSKPADLRFDLAVNNTAAHQVFTAIVTGTRYSILVPADVSGSMSLNLKDVTVLEALEAIRETYGYEYRVDGSRIYIQPLSMQTRIFQVNYLTGMRSGTTSVRVTSSAISDAPPSSTSGSSVSSGQSSGQGTTIVGVADKGNNFAPGPDNSSKVTTTTSSDFWSELRMAIGAIVGAENGRSVIISPMSGVIVVRAMPEELRNVAAYLKASQISIERQVILEAKIVEVQLNDVFQSGVNWAAFGRDPASLGSAGVLGPNATLQPSTAGVGAVLSNNPLTATPGSSLIANTAEAGGISAGGMFGLAFQTNNFAALLNFLEGQGSIHVLSSPRIATLNNQKAVLKVGTDEFFVTGLSTTTSAVGTSSSTTPTVTLQPFFSGIALDVTPRIDGNNEIILHVHPSVGKVTTVNKVIDMGSVTGSLTLPLASSSISETDSIVRARDGQIVAIGGLMREGTIEGEAGIPGLSKILFGQTSRVSEKRELVILIKPTIVNGDREWSEDITRSRDRVNGLVR